VAAEQVDCVFSDPPYNVGYEGYTDDRLTIQNDRMSPEAFAQFLRDSFKSFRSAIKLGGSLYICHASSVQRQFEDAIEAAGLSVR
jgi:DNA modification methylase